VATVRLREFYDSAVRAGLAAAGGRAGASVTLDPVRLAADAQSQGFSEQGRVAQRVPAHFLLQRVFCSLRM
jgi:hypothetical protein